MENSGIKLKSTCLILLWMLLLLNPVSKIRAGEDSWKLTLFTPRKEKDPFWGLFVDHARKATSDLGGQIEVYYADGNREKMRRQIEQAASKAGDQEVLVFPNFKKGAGSFLKIIEKKKVPAFIVNSGFTKEENGGRPRQHFRFWIGQLLPDEKQTGNMLARTLVEEGLRRFKKHRNGPLEMIAITGIISDYASIERTEGLKRYAMTEKKVFLRQIIPASWKADAAETGFELLKKRFPKLRLVWTASDVMAGGVIRAAEKMQLNPGKDLIVGGVDWADQGLQSVQQGKQYASAGGHFLEGGWATVLVYDYLQGKDFAEHGLSWKSRMGLIRSSDWGSKSEMFQRIKPDNINYRKYSRYLHPERDSYDFSLESLKSGEYMVNGN